MNEHEFRVASSRRWPTGVMLPSRPQPVLTSVPSGAKASTSKRDESEVSHLSLLQAFCVDNFVHRSYPPSTSADFYLPDVRT